MKITKMISRAALSAFALTCGIAMSAANPAKQPVNGYPTFAIGGDLSWTNRIIAEGSPTYYTSSKGTAVTTIPEMAADYGLDAIRLRVWVNPDNALVSSGFSYKQGSYTYSVGGTYGYCDLDDMVAMAKTFAESGHRFMVCFHFSDTWADPGKQFIPSDWASCTTLDQLKARVTYHVESVLATLRNANINVEWVQIGNETNNGMMRFNLPSSSGASISENTVIGCGISSSNATSFVKIFNAAAESSRKIYPQVKTVLHLANGHRIDKLRWTLNSLRNSGFSHDFCDYVGLSLYPEDATDLTANWQAETDACLDNIKTIYSDYGFRTLLCEIGMNNEWSESTTKTDQRSNIAQCNADVEAFTRHLVENLKERQDEYNCDGFFYWEPETDYIDNYKRGACYDIDGKWARSRVTPNSYWDVCREASSFPDGGLKNFELTPVDMPEPPGDNEVVPDDPDTTPLYIVSSCNSWNYSAPDTFVYHEDTGLYTASLTVADNDLWVAIGTKYSDSDDASGTYFKKFLLSPTGTIKNGTTLPLTSHSTFALPYAADWTITVDLAAATILCSTPTAPPSDLDTYSIYNDTDYKTYKMHTTDGIAYWLTDFAQPQWFNFRVLRNQEWTGGVWGGVAVDPSGETVLKNANSNSWLTAAVTADDYWWYNAETCTIAFTKSASNPWHKAGDCNSDGMIDATDIAYMIDTMLGIAHSDFDATAADLNADGKLNATDISHLISLILN